MKPVFLSLLLLLFPAAHGQATFYLESGDEFEGAVVSFENGQIVVSIDSGTVKKLPFPRVVAIKSGAGLVNGPFDLPALERLFPAAKGPASAGTHSAPAGSPADSGSRAGSDPGLKAGPDPEGKRRPKGGEGPYRLSLQAKPASFLFSQIFADDAPYPVRFAVGRVRLFGLLALESEPVIIQGGNGGFGFMAGFAILQPYDGFDANPVTVAAKYNYLYYSTWGPEGRLIVEITRQVRTGNFLLGLGGLAGYGFTGLTWRENEGPRGKKVDILATQSGPFVGLVLDMGFCL